ncbi:putative hemolysin [Caulobacter ginsengisoli]|uniref:Hemolysin n=1 Tax=Caulobacter ginsengisoli TaxID=400775 RepID=A0ABU0IQP3_9CAUL|nr:hypothetical protein [Caulobacter ginsengisoli]MDQ0464336.1 putative hemolysin [Caulobacter ginsengisoli]
MRTVVIAAATYLMLGACTGPQATNKPPAKPDMPSREYLEAFCKAKGGHLKANDGAPGSKAFYSCDIPSAPPMKAH